MRLKDLKNQYPKKPDFISEMIEAEVEKQIHTQETVRRNKKKKQVWTLGRTATAAAVACVLIGTDVPEIKQADLDYAFRLLDVHDVVLGPTHDGGYYLVGMKKPVREVFEKQTYSHASVLENTAKAAFEAGYTVGFARTLHDIDEKEDICKFRNRMRKNQALQKSETGRYLLKKQKISIIVPIYNEESTIESLQKQLIPLLDKCEILFVDGGSKDRTLSMIDSRFRVLHSEKGRANQMNLGAKESSGDILFFLQIFLFFHTQKLFVQNLPN